MTNLKIFFITLFLIFSCADQKGNSRINKKLEKPPDVFQIIEKLNFLEREFI
tara:strand:+ start:748 stop:903 length:156 start_codon:yes stop_codon:yes gene_type:complete